MSGGRRAVLAAVASSADEETIRTALPSGAPFHAVSLQQAANRGAELVEEVGATLAVVTCGDTAAAALAAIRAIASGQPDCPILVAYHGDPNGFLAAAFEAGADDVVSLPLSPEQLGFAIEKVVARSRGTVAARASGLLIAVLGPKGGTGKTLTACNLAVALAEEGSRPLVVDLDLQFGDVGLALGLKPDRTIYDLAVSGGSLDADKVDAFTVAHPSGVHALLAPVRPDQAAAVDPTFLTRVFELARSRHDVVIVDTPPSFSPEVIAAIDGATHLCVVGMLDLLSLKDTKIGLETLGRMGHDPARATLVLNRADTKVGIGAEDVESLLGRAPDVCIPSDRAVPRAITEGRTIVEAEPASAAARAFRALAASYLAEVPEAPVPVRVHAEPVTPRRLVLLRKGV